MTSVRTFGIAGTTDPAEDYRLIDSGLLVPASALNARSGVTCTPTLTGTGALTCNISAFTAVIDGTSNSLQGVYRIAVDGPSAITVTAGSAQARVDLVYAQILDNNYDGSGQLKGQVQYLAGTSGSGSPPATPANAIPLFNIPVPASASSLDFTTAVPKFQYTAAVGGIVPVRNASDQPAAAAGVQYRHRLDVAAAAGAVTPLESSTDGSTWTPVFDPNGFTWQSYTTAWTASTTNPAIGNGLLAMRYCKIGKTVFVRLHMATSNLTTFGVGVWGFSMPYPVANLNSVPSGSAYANVSGTYFYGAPIVSGSTTSSVLAVFGSGGNPLDSTHPGTWATNCLLEMTFFYETS